MGNVILNNLSARQKAVIENNLNAYVANFGYIRIDKEGSGNGFYVFTDRDRSYDGWTQYCYNVDYLNGWLYGAVQAANGVMKKSQ